VLAGLAAATAGFVATGVAVGSLWSARGHRGPASPHFDGRRFRHPWPAGGQSLLDTAAFLPGWFARRGFGQWTDRRGQGTAAVPPDRVIEGLRVTFINHASFLLQGEGVNLLVDPVFSLRVAPLQFAGPRRFRDPGIQRDDLPPIDGVLLSHNHYDHLDLPFLRWLVARDAPRILAPLGNAQDLLRRGVPGAADLDWWDEASFGPLTITLTPAQHFSGRGLLDRNRTLWGGFCVRSPAGTVLFAGDTGYGPHFDQIRQRLGAPDLALLGVGAYRPRAFMKPVHMDPADALLAATDLQAAVSVPMHYGTFKLGLDGMTEAADVVEELCAAQPGAPRFHRLAEGAHLTLPLEPDPEPAGE